MGPPDAESGCTEREAWGPEGRGQKNKSLQIKGLGITLRNIK